MTAALKTKTCSKCSLAKEISEFYKDRRIKSGYGAECKSCRGVKIAVWQAENKEKCDEILARWRTKNREVVNSRSRQAYTGKAKSENLRNKEWRENNPDKESARKKRWRAENKEKWIGCVVDWQKRNPEKVAVINKRARIKRGMVPKYQISKNISNGIRKSIISEKSNRHWETLVDFTLEQLMTHLESHFDSHMTWENHGTYWHIDHTQPIASFNFKAPEDPEFKQCWALENLQPLEARQNISKGAKLDWQPIGEIK